MKDTLGRKIDYLRIAVTDRCNFRCIYCMGEQGVEKKEHREILSLEELTEIGKAAIGLGVRKIRLTGGEPLVRKGILDLCHELKLNTGLEELVMTTNGALLPQYAAALREAGVERLNISLDTLRPDRFRRISRCGDPEATFTGIRAAEAAGFRQIKLNVVLMGGVNEDEIADFCALTREHPFSVRFIELMPIGECAAWPKERFLPADRVLEMVPELQPSETDGVAALYRLPGAIGSVGLIRPISHRFCAGCNRIRLTPDGMLKPCLHSPVEIPLRGLKGEALTEALKRGIMEKPAEHHLTEEGRSAVLNRKMHEIGG